MIKTFNILSNIYGSRLTISFKSNFPSARGHNLKLFLQHVIFNVKKWFSTCISNIWHHLRSIVNTLGVMCVSKRLDKCRARLKIKFDHEASLNYTEFECIQFNILTNINFDGKPSVEANDI